MMRSVLSCAALSLAIGALAQSSSERAAVQLTASVQASPPSITLSWKAIAGTTSFQVYRKLRSDAAWGSLLASPAATATQYTDNTVSIGTAYEYKVVRVSSGVTGTGYISSGIHVPVTDARGKILLLVDNTLAVPLAAELTQLARDLKADGWTVLRSDVSPSATVSSVRSTVIAQYNTDPSNFRSVFIIGHVPVPYSGNINPDGHSSHLGAWPCDAYYADVNGTWTDNTVNSTGGYPKNQNVPGDGKFDQSDLPSAIELRVGRVDMNNMPAFTLSEVELTRAYLNKLHNYKVKAWAPQVRGMMFDNLQWVSNPLAASGWRSMAPLTGHTTISAPYQYGTPFKTLIDGQSHLWTYSSGGGLQGSVNNTLTFNGADNVGTTEDYALLAGGMDGVFNMSFGSYFGDWDNPNNFLRAPLAHGDALTNVWSSIPAWYFHHMGMGEPIGNSMIATLNNTGLYTPLTDGWQSSIGRVHLALMGDPTLRQAMVAPPTNLAVTNASGLAAFSWTASAETVQGYHLYSISGSGVITRLTTNPVTGTSHQSPTIPFVSGAEYMVRAVKLLTSPSGSYFDLSLGALAVASGSGSPPAAPDCLGVSGGTALPGTSCNDGNACTVNDVYNSSCQCVGTPVTVTASITAAGPTTFCNGGSVVLNANTGAGLSYQWRNNGTAISGATASSHTATAAGSYTVVVSNGSCSTTSAAVTVSVTNNLIATISTTMPQLFCQGGSCVLTANTGAGYTYQWFRNGTAITGATGINYAATTSGGYSVQVSSGGCSALSTNTPVQVDPAPAATITAAGATTFCAGGSVVLNANTGSGLTYQWRRDGAAIAGATTASFTATLAGSYTVVVANSACSTTSAATVVSVGSALAPSVSASGSTAFCAGGQVVLSTTSGTGLSYQWRNNGTAMAGATSASYTATAAGAYSVMVSNGSCSGVSGNTTVSVSTAPSVACTANATAQTVSATATGGMAPYTYAWSTSPVQTTATATVTASGTYTCTVTDAKGCTSMGSASITITPTDPCAGTRTETQAAWGATSGAAATYLTGNFAAAFPSGLTIGCTRRLVLTSATAVTNFLPSTGTSAVLPSGTLTNPTTYGNSLAGELVAAKLSVRFDELNAAFSPASVLLKNMVVASGTFAGWTVQQVIDEADRKIGGCGGLYTRSSLNTALAAINNGYAGGTAASGYLVCPSTRMNEAAPYPADETGLSLRVFPNPVAGSTTMEVGTVYEAAGPLDLVIMSVSGQVVHQRTVAIDVASDVTRLHWDASAVSPGVYLVVLISGERRVVQRLVVEP